VVDNVILNLAAQLIVSNIWTVLRRNHHRFHAKRPAVAVLNCYLLSSVRPQVGKFT
jgi:hypothetical protein